MQDIFTVLETNKCIVQKYTVKCRCNERQYNEMFRIAKLFLGPFPFPYLMCVKTFHFNEFRTFSITKYSNDMVAIFHTCMQLVEQDIDLKVTNMLCASSNARSHAIGWVGSKVYNQPMNVTISYL